MYRKIGAAVAAITFAGVLPFAFGAISTAQSDAQTIECVCCKDGCTCEKCVCDQQDCCDDSGTCTTGCCPSCC